MGVNLLMNYNIIENLVIESKEGNQKSKEKLLEEFKPFILNISSKTHIDGYSNYDLQNECYAILLKCVNKYNPEKHRFVAYGTNAIKNGLYTLLRNTKRREKLEGTYTLTSDGNLESLNLFSYGAIDDKILKDCELKEINFAINELSKEEKEFLNFIIINNKTVKEYAKNKNISYSSALYKKSLLIKKISNSISI